MATDVIQFTTPILVGQYLNQITISRIRLASISFNFQSAYTAAGTAVCSIILEDYDSGQQFAVITHNDAAALTLAMEAQAAQIVSLSSSLGDECLKLAMAELDPVSGKPVIPPGAIVSV